VLGLLVGENMICKTFELRDRGTFIPVIAVKLVPVTEADRYLLARAGYGTTPERQSEYIFLCRISGGEGKGACGPYEWGTLARTLPQAHQYIIDNFDGLCTGDVVDVEFILGETKAPKQSERYTDPC
jgi:hypothetical protein